MVGIGESVGVGVGGIGVGVTFVTVTELTRVLPIQSSNALFPFGIVIVWLPDVASAPGSSETSPPSE